MPQRKDIYYLAAILGVVVFFGAAIIPQVTRLLLFYGLDLWIVILIVCVFIPLFAVALLWLIVYEIQQYFNTAELSDQEVAASQLVDRVYTPEDDQFIEAKMREQLEKFQFQDEDAYEIYSDLIFTYIRNRIKTDSEIPLEDISNMVNIPKEVVKDILLVQIAEGLIDGSIENDLLKI